MNHVTLVGRLGQDPEVKYISSGRAVCTMSMATDESYKDNNGERQQRTEWHRLVLWGKTAEIAGQYLRKGFQTAVEGRIQSRQWEDKEGNKRTAYEIVVTRLHLLGGNPKVEETGGQGQGIVDDSDIPF